MICYMVNPLLFLIVCNLCYRLQSLIAVLIRDSRVNIRTSKFFVSKDFFDHSKVQTPRKPPQSTAHSSTYSNMSSVIRARSADELCQLNHKERSDTLVEMSIEMLHSLTPVELENITFDWFRAYHATMCNCNYNEVKQINELAPQLRRTTLHNIILLRDDRSFDQLDTPTVEGLKTIFLERKSQAGLPLFTLFTPSTITTHEPANEFSVPDSFFTRTLRPWAAQADQLHTGLERFNLSRDNNNPPHQHSVQQQQQHAGSFLDTNLQESQLSTLNLGHQAAASSGSTSADNHPGRLAKPSRVKKPVSRKYEEARRRRRL